jgi:hypothetical protein
MRINPGGRNHVYVNAAVALPCGPSATDCKLATSTISRFIRASGTQVFRIRPDNTNFVSWYVVAELLNAHRERREKITKNRINGMQQSGTATKKKKKGKKENKPTTTTTTTTKNYKHRLEPLIETPSHASVFLANSILCRLLSNPQYPSYLFFLFYHSL